MNQNAYVVSAPTFENSQDHLLHGMAIVDMRIKWAVTRARANGNNFEDEFRGLYISDDQIDELLSYDIGQHRWSHPNSNGQHPSWKESIEEVEAEWQEKTVASVEKGVSLRLEQLIRAFQLAPMEVESFLVALAPELDSRYAQIFAYLQDDVTRKRPSIDLILNLLAETFADKLHLRSLFSNQSSLFRNRLLIRFNDSPNQSFLFQYVRPYDHLIEYLLGATVIDDSLMDIAQLYTPDNISSSNQQSSRLFQKVQGVMESSETSPLFSFSGVEGTGRNKFAQQLAKKANQSLLWIDLTTLAKGDLGIREGLRLLLRDGRLHHAILYLDHWETILEDSHPPKALFDELLTYPHTIIVASNRNWQPSRHLFNKPIFNVPFATPDFDGRLAIWRSYLGDQAGLDLTAVANHFRFTSGQIEDAIATAHDLAQWHGKPVQTADLLLASRAHSNPNLEALAVKIHPRYTWKDIVLPDDTMRQLQEMVNTVRQRPTVYGDWGFERKLALGKGLSTLFAGESGTGKTMSADIIAGELGLDLYKIDLSSVISKYIGETEKNLERIFTEAATSNAILFFDEADAIFGKRSEVKDSHDRYANIEISYLLQRMEAYDGVVILATNLRANLDDAFTRRLHFAVEFPFPEPADRERIWQVNFPSETPLAAGVDFELLAKRYPLAGGNIRNVILAAAFLAAEDGVPVGMPQLLHATRREYQKMGRLIDDRLFEIPV